MTLLRRDCCHPPDESGAAEVTARVVLYHPSPSIQVRYLDSIHVPRTTHPRDRHKHRAPRPQGFTWQITLITITGIYLFYLTFQSSI